MSGSIDSLANSHDFRPKKRPDPFWKSKYPTTFVYSKSKLNPLSNNKFDKNHRNKPEKNLIKSFKPKIGNEARVTWNTLNLEC